MIRSRWHVILVSIFLFSAIGSYGQTNEGAISERIENLMVQDSLEKAQELLDKEIAQATSNRNYVILSELLYWLGKLEITSNVDKSFPKAIALSEKIRSNSSNDKILFQTYLDLSRLHNEKGNATKAYEVATLAKSHVLKNNDEEMLADVHYYLGEYGLRSGNINTFEENIRNAFGILDRNPTKEFKLSAKIFNYMGALMYLTAKPDSAFVYYQKALDKVGVMEKKPENQLYFSAAIKANMVLLKQSQNQYDEALQLAQECISLNNQFLQSRKTHPLRFRAQRNLSLAYRNLASLYEQVGDYEKTYRIAKLAYAHAKANFTPDLLEYFSSITLLAEAEISRKEFDTAIEILKEARLSLDVMQGENPLLRANLASITGGAYFGKKDYKDARYYYMQGQGFHKKAQNEVSSDGLFATINLALCHAHLGEKTMAMEVLENAYESQVKSDIANKRITNILLVAMARTADLSKDFEESHKWSTKFLEENREEGNAAVDPYLAEAILLNTKAKYQRHASKDIPFLKELRMSVNEVFGILENRRAIITSEDNVNALIQDNREVFDFAKKLNLELFDKTREDTFLNAVLSLHESAIYSRIRARLNLRKDISFSNLPEKIQDREKFLKHKLEAGTHDNMDVFMKDLNGWNGFLDSLRQVHPDYY